MLQYVFKEHSVFCMRTVVTLIPWHAHTQANFPDIVVMNSLHLPHTSLVSPPRSLPPCENALLSVSRASCNTTPGHSYFIYFAFTPSSPRTGFPTVGVEEKTRECLSQELRDHLNVGVYTPLVTRTEKCHKIGVWSWLIWPQTCSRMQKLLCISTISQCQKYFLTVFISDRLDDRFAHEFRPFLVHTYRLLWHADREANRNRIKLTRRAVRKTNKQIDRYRWKTCRQKVLPRPLESVRFWISFTIAL